MVRQACNFDFSVGGERKDKNVENQTRETGEAEATGKILKGERASF